MTSSLGFSQSQQYLTIQTRVSSRAELWAAPIVLKLQLLHHQPPTWWRAFKVPPIKKSHQPILRQQQLFPFHLLPTPHLPFLQRRHYRRRALPALEAPLAPA
jgi:hypothetical protein